MSTLAQLRSIIADKINRSDLNSQINTEINRAIEFYSNEEPFWFNESVDTFSTVLSQEAYTSSDASFITNIKEIAYIEITLATTNVQPLNPRTIQWIQQMNQGRVNGIPTDYAWFNKSIYFYLIPNGVYTITVYSTKGYAELANDSDTNDFTTYARDLIEARAMRYMYNDYLGDDAGVSRMTIKENEALQGLRNATLSKKGTNLIVPINI